MKTDIQIRKIVEEIKEIERKHNGSSPTRIGIHNNIYRLMEMHPEMSKLEAAQEILSLTKLKCKPVAYKKKHKPGSESWDVDSYNDFN